MILYVFLFNYYICICYGNFHVPLYRVIPSENIYPKESDINLKNVGKSLKNSINNVITLFETDLDGISGYGYYLKVGIGTPPQYFKMVIDTGSSNTAIGASPHPFLSSYFHSELSTTFTNYGESVAIAYDSGKWNGFYGSDIFHLFGISYIDSNRSLKHPDNITVRSDIGLIKETSTFFVKNGKFQGIIGLAYPILLQPSKTTRKLTLFNELVLKYRINNMFSVVLCGSNNRSNSQPVTSGYFIAGGKNRSLYTDPMVDILVHRKWFYEVIISRISIFSKPIILSSCKKYNRDKTILDTGTADTYFSSLIFHSLISSILFNMNRAPFILTKNSAFWKRKAVLCVINNSSRHPAAYFPEIHFSLVINDTASLEVALSPEQYIQYVGTQTDIFGNQRDCYKFGFGMSKTGTVLGNSFLEGFYVLFDRDKGKVGIAQSKCNHHSANLPRSRIIQIHNKQAGLLDCAVSQTSSNSILDRISPTLTIVFGVMFCLIFIPSLALLIHFRCYSAPNPESSNLIQPQTNQNLPFYNTVQ